MNRGIYPILSGAIAQERQMAGFAHNIANVNTTGFKQEDVLFKSHITRHLSLMPPAGEVNLVAQLWSPGAPVPERVFVAPNGSKTVFDAGRLRPTSNPYDFAIQGSGFFEIKTPEGIRYTRDGVFHLDAKRKLVTEAGYPVMGVKGELKIPEGDFKMDGRGTISVNNQTVGTLKIVEFPEDAMPQRLAEGYFAGPGAKVMKAPTVLSGAIEESNVNPLGEMVKMIQGMRTYESAQKIIQAFDRMTELAVNDIGRVQG